MDVSWAGRIGSAVKIAISKTERESDGSCALPVTWGVEKLRGEPAGTRGEGKG